MTLGVTVPVRSTITHNSGPFKSLSEQHSRYNELAVIVGIAE
jgi:hypothetical protein